jgi:hypothetical protein
LSGSAVGFGARGLTSDSDSLTRCAISIRLPLLWVREQFHQPDSLRDFDQAAIAGFLCASNSVSLTRCAISIRLPLLWVRD